MMRMFRIELLLLLEVSIPRPIGLSGVITGPGTQPVSPAGGQNFEVRAELEPLQSTTAELQEGMRRFVSSQSFQGR